ncbi:hypothetical protein V6Z11_A01G105300 [Gossypium hirsutum]
MAFKTLFFLQRIKRYRTLSTEQALIWLQLQPDLRPGITALMVDMIDGGLDLGAGRRSLNLPELAAV